MIESLHQKYKKTRAHSLDICSCLEVEDFSCQPELFVSPPKWHLAHSTWFFEEFILKKALRNYKPFHPKFHFLFNSYYETAGEHLLRNRRGTLSRPTVNDIREYRQHVDHYVEQLLHQDLPQEYKSLCVTGINHEQQHQELLLMDIKYILGTNPLFPSCNLKNLLNRIVDRDVRSDHTIKMEEGVYTIGYRGDEFAFDNEGPPHKVYLQAFELGTDLITTNEYLEFILDGGYDRVDLWLSDGWDWRKTNSIAAPLYWHKIDGVWCCYDFEGIRPLPPKEPVMHVSHYEANAFAAWKGKRLPTEFEWEAAAGLMDWGLCWEHTMSAYLPYPGYKRPEGTIGEYNAKFMSNQMVLRGASIATPRGHERVTYRNFFSPDMRWQFSGVRLAQTV